MCVYFPFILKTLSGLTMLGFRMPGIMGGAETPATLAAVIQTNTVSHRYHTRLTQRPSPSLRSPSPCVLSSPLSFVVVAHHHHHRHRHHHHLIIINIIITITIIIIIIVIVIIIRWCPSRRRLSLLEEVETGVLTMLSKEVRQALRGYCPQSIREGLVSRRRPFPRRPWAGGRTSSAREHVLHWHVGRVYVIGQHRCVPRPWIGIGFLFLFS